MAGGRVLLTAYRARPASRHTPRRWPGRRLEGTLDRHDFGIRPPQPFEMIVGDEVKLNVDILAVPA